MNGKMNDLNRIAEIEIFIYRLIFYPIFQNDWFYFEHLHGKIFCETKTGHHRYLEKLR